VRITERGTALCSAPRALTFHSDDVAFQQQSSATIRMTVEGLGDRP
jgi:hypothetical protein